MHIPTEFFMAMLVCAIHSTLAAEQMVYNESTMIITTVKPSSETTQNMTSTAEIEATSYLWLGIVLAVALVL